MALNFSHRQFSSHLSEEPMKIANGYHLVEGMSERNWCSSFDKGDCFDYGRNNTGDSASVDILDLLPSDPFGMDINNTFTAINGWLQDLDYNNQYGRRRDDIWIGDGNHQHLFAGLSFIWNNAMQFREFPESSSRSGYNNGSGEAFDGDESCHGAFISASSVDEVLSIEDSRNCEVKGGGNENGYNYGFGVAFDDDESCHGAFISASSVDEVMSIKDSRNCEVKGGGNENGYNYGFGVAFDGDESCHGAFISASSVDEVLSLEDSRNCEVGGSSDHCTNGGGNENVHQAFGFCLYHLGVKDLLSVSMVCKSLQTTVFCDDLLLWKHIHISHPLNEKITEEALLHLTERAQGTLQCLRLVDCSRIADDSLRRVLERNPQVVKLGVPGCTRITIDGIMSILRDLKSAGKLQVKHLEIGGLFGVTKEHYNELSDFLNLDNNIKQTIHKQRFYHRGDSCVSCADDDKALDIEICPRCQNPRLVYDCPADCKGKKEGYGECRACSLCIQRCYQCGRCINDGEYEETFCLQFLCADCSKPASEMPASEF